MLANYTKRVVLSTRMYLQETLYFYRARRCASDNSGEKGFNDDFRNNDVTDIIQGVFRTSSGSPSTYVIQPYIKWGVNKNRLTTPELQLDESITLVKTLRDWNVADSKIVSMGSYDKGKFFGTGKLEELKSEICRNEAITSIFVSTNMLTPAQHEFLENFFAKPVYDRYLIIMQIFREHAVSNEAKLQIALAEIPYLESRVSYAYHSSTQNIGGRVAKLNTASHLSPEKRRLHIHNYESSVKKEIEKLRAKRDDLRERHRKSEIPIVAVVGYTNSGKTSIIKALTGKRDLQPEDYLFATLDVTYHQGYLPGNLKVLFVDTIGFISDIPTGLVEPFNVTLRDATQADVILHVKDISHPDQLNQSEHVSKTLRDLEVGEKLLNHVVVAANKADKIKYNKKLDVANAVLTSCVESVGLKELGEMLREQVIKATNRKVMTIKIKTGGEEEQWLRRECAVAEVKPDENDINYSFVTVYITDSALHQFKHKFISGKDKRVARK